MKRIKLRDEDGDFEGRVIKEEDDRVMVMVDGYRLPHWYCKSKILDPAPEDEKA